MRRVRAGADDGPLAQDGGSDHEMDIEYGVSTQCTSNGNSLKAFKSAVK